MLACNQPQTQVLVETHFHGLSIDLDRVELLGSSCCAVWLGEDDGGDADATAVLVVVEEDLLDGANSLSEVFLKAKVLVHIWRQLRIAMRIHIPADDKARPGRYIKFGT